MLVLMSFVGIFCVVMGTIMPKEDMEDNLMWVVSGAIATKIMERRLMEKRS